MGQSSELGPGQHKGCELYVVIRQKPLQEWAQLCKEHSWNCCAQGDCKSEVVKTSVECPSIKEDNLGGKKCKTLPVTLL